MTMKARILIVEDDPATRITLAHLLQYAGYHVTQAEDGETAVELLDKERFDVVVTDIVMGAIDGIEVLHTARLQPYRPDVILLTGHGTLDTAVAALRSGAYDYLMKPCDDEVLIAAVERAVQEHQDAQNMRQAAAMIKDFYERTLGEPTPETEETTTTSPTVPVRPSPVLRIGSLVLGKTRNDASLRGESLQLTPIEFEMLRFLAEMPGEIRSYREIVQHTHRFDTDDTEAQMLVKQHIRNLRRKLDAGYLVNERGVGYKLVDPEED